jgi:4-hydroxy-tetrahydrodipicolinate reductase
MGKQTVAAVSAEPDMELVGGFDPTESGTVVATAGAGAPAQTPAPVPAFRNLRAAIEQCRPDVIVDFTLPSAVAGNLEVAMSLGVDCVVGTTGITDDTLQSLIAKAPARTTLFVAPNFTTGAVLMMAAAKMAARYFPDVEILEFHHNNKADSPSGTAVNTAQSLAQIREQAGLSSASPGSETEIAGMQGARGATLRDIRLHSVRSNGFVASQEIIFGSPGQTLTIRHDSIDRSAYMPGLLLAIRSVGARSGLIVGLEELMEL